MDSRGVILLRYFGMRCTIIRVNYGSDRPDLNLK